MAAAEAQGEVMAPLSSLPWGPARPAPHLKVDVLSPPPPPCSRCFPSVASILYLLLPFSFILSTVSSFL